MKTRFAVAVVGFSLLSISIHAQTASVTRAEKIKALSYLIGTWEVSSEERDSEGQGFRQTGTWVCTYDHDSTVIRRDMSYTVTYSLGREYETMAKKRKFTELMLFNTSSNLYETFEYSGGAAPFRLGSLVVDLRNKAIRRSYVSFDSHKKVTLENISEMKAVSPLEILHTIKSTALESPYEITFVSTARKIK